MLYSKEENKSNWMYCQVSLWITLLSKKKETVKLLGVSFDEGLNKKFHINYTSKMMADSLLSMLGPLEI